MQNHTNATQNRPPTLHKYWINVRQCGNEVEKCGTSVVIGMVGYSKIDTTIISSHATMIRQRHCIDTTLIQLSISLVQQLYNNFTTL